MSRDSDKEPLLVSYWYFHNLMSIVLLQVSLSFAQTVNCEVKRGVTVSSVSVYCSHVVTHVLAIDVFVTMKGTT